MDTLTVRAAVIAGSAVCSLGVWGLFIDAPYWRAVGDGLTLFTCTTWAAIFLNGLAWLVARPLAWTVTTQVEWQFVVEHLLWASLAALQWALVLWAARLPATKATTIIAVAISVIAALLGLISWDALWPKVHGEHIHWSLLDWPVGLFGAALLPALYLWLQRQYGRTRPNNAMDSDTVRSPLRAPHGARHRER